ncbi:MAG: hypothetical protein E6G67_13550 [Actinobacteria bacterium]|nr:MAG: hypothetical protein E6G67_13550 [Actinomycetota bacterium]
MIRVFVLYPEPPDQERYEQHVELSRREVPHATIRHGRIFGSPQGEPDFAYYFEYEFPDRDAFRASEGGLSKAAEDANAMGIDFRVFFASVQ